MSKYALHLEEIKLTGQADTEFKVSHAPMAVRVLVAIDPDARYYQWFAAQEYSLKRGWSGLNTDERSDFLKFEEQEEEEVGGVTLQPTNLCIFVHLIFQV